MNLQINEYIHIKDNIVENGDSIVAENPGILIRALYLLSIQRLATNQFFHDMYAGGGTTTAQERQLHENATTAPKSLFGMEMQVYTQLYKMNCYD